MSFKKIINKLFAEVELVPENFTVNAIDVQPNKRAHCDSFRVECTQKNGNRVEIKQFDYEKDKVEIIRVDGLDVPEMIYTAKEVTNHGIYRLIFGKKLELFGAAKISIPKDYKIGGTSTTSY